VGTGQPIWLENSLPHKYNTLLAFLHPRTTQRYINAFISIIFIHYSIS